MLNETPSRHMPIKPQLGSYDQRHHRREGAMIEARIGGRCVRKAEGEETQSLNSLEEHDAVATVGVMFNGNTITTKHSGFDRAPASLSVRFPTEEIAIEAQKMLDNAGFPRH